MKMRTTILKKYKSDRMIYTKVEMTKLISWSFRLPASTRLPTRKWSLLKLVLVKEVEVNNGPQLKMVRVKNGLSQKCFLLKMASSKNYSS